MGKTFLYIKKLDLKQFGNKEMFSISGSEVNVSSI